MFATERNESMTQFLSTNLYEDKTSKKQGRIHGNPVADGWAGGVMRKPLGIQKCDGRTYRHTDRPTRQGVEARVRD